MASLAAVTSKINTKERIIINTRERKVSLPPLVCLHYYGGIAKRKVGEEGLGTRLMSCLFFLSSSKIDHEDNVHMHAYTQWCRRGGGGVQVCL